MKDRLSYWAALAVTGWLAALAGPAAGAGAEQASAESSVRQAQAARMRAASAGNVDAWMALYAADAIVLLPQDAPVSGLAPVRAAVARLLALPHLALAPQPGRVQMARSGDLALISAAYEMRFADERGAPAVERGSHLEIWKRQGTGAWQCSVDAWSADSAAGPPGAAAPSAPALPAGAAAAALAAAPPAPPAPAAAPPPAPAAAPPPVPSAQAAAPESSAGAPPRPALLRDRKYGEQPLHYEETIRQYFQVRLKDPDSVQYKDISKPEKGYTTGVSGTLLMSETRNYGWKVTATINAMNIAGQYVGFKSYTFLFRGEKIVDALLPLPQGEIN